MKKLLLTALAVFMVLPFITAYPVEAKDPSPLNMPHCDI